MKWLRASIVHLHCPRCGAVSELRIPYVKVAKFNEQRKAAQEMADAFKEGGETTILTAVEGWEKLMGRVR